MVLCLSLGAVAFAYAPRAAQAPFADEPALTPPPRAQCGPGSRPETGVQGRVSPEDQVALAERGALLERAFTTAYTGKCEWEAFVAATRAVGPHNTVWGSDLGQRFNPPVEDGLAIMADRFLEAGFSEEEVRIMAVENTRRLAGVPDA